MENEILDGTYEPTGGNKTSRVAGHILKYSSVFLALLLAYWALNEYAYRYMEPNITIVIAPFAGLIIIVVLFILLLVSSKRYLKNNAGAGMFFLTMLGTAIGFVAIATFQLVRLPFFGFNYSITILLSSLYLVFFGMALSFFIAFQLKTRRTGMLILMIVTFFILLGLLARYVPGLGTPG